MTIADMTLVLFATALTTLTSLPLASGLAKVDGQKNSAVPELSGRPRRHRKPGDLMLRRTRVNLNDLDESEDDADQTSAQNPHGPNLKLKSDYPYYHSSDEIRTTLKSLQTKCAGAELRLNTAWDGDMSIDYVRVRGVGSQPHNKVFLLSGEHARELIGTESTLHLIKALCGADDGAAQRNSTVSVRAALRSSEFMFVVVGNPLSRMRVEEGDYCLRANPNGVDLNRNWDENWNGSMTVTTERGTEPFSEKETRIVRKLIENYKPNAFVSVHSGTLGMYMPWAWSFNDLADRNQDLMMNVLRKLDGMHCKCPFGAAGKEVGYPCPGTSVDYVYDKLKARYSFAFEIWGAPSEMWGLRRRWERKMEQGGMLLLQKGAHLGHPHFHDVFNPRAERRIQSDFLHVGTESVQPDGMQSAECFGLFNPDNEQAFLHTINNWAALFLEMSDMTAKSQ